MSKTNILYITKILLKLITQLKEWTYYIAVNIYEEFFILIQKYKSK